MNRLFFSVPRSLFHRFFFETAISHEQGREPGRRRQKRFKERKGRRPLGCWAQSHPPNTPPPPPPQTKTTTPPPPKPKHPKLQKHNPHPPHPPNPHPPTQPTTTPTHPNPQPIPPPPPPPTTPHQTLLVSSCRLSVSPTILLAPPLMACGSLTQTPPPRS